MAALAHNQTSLRLDGRKFLDRFQNQVVTLNVDRDHGVRLESPVEQSFRERILDQVLDEPAQWPRAIGMIVAALAQEILRFVIDHERDLLLGELLADAFSLKFDDLADLLLRQRMEDDRRVDPVQELGSEGLLELRPSPFRSSDRIRAASVLSSSPWN